VLLDEAYRQLAAGAQPAASDQAQFRGFAAHTMRGVLVDHARALASGPLSAGTITITLPRNGAPPAVAEAEPDLLDLDRALGQLEQLDPLQSRVVELRYFGGLSIEGAAAALGIAADAAGREWVLGKTWIRRWLMERARGR
jgi:RNA polymerase sigma factor (TIGR02999 family)